MEQRKRIGIVFNFSSGWLGGIYYIINIVKTLNFLDDKDRPEVYLFYNKDTAQFLGEFSYPYLHKINWQFTPLFKTFLSSWITGKNKFVSKMVEEYDLQAIYPLHNHPLPANKSIGSDVKLVSWYADLQHRYYPEFFSKKQRAMREIRLYLLLKNTTDLVVSSQSVADDFYKFYKIRKDLKLHIYHFTSIIDSFNFTAMNKLTSKFGLPKKYYLVSNQFHKHKNHKVLLESIGILKKKNVQIHIAFTGKFPDKKTSPYIEELYRLIDTLELDQWVTFLGVISRHDQLSLMHHCQAVIQPSLFEGWSTVIEDAISIQTPVIAANLDVNIEQLGEQGTFFKPLDKNELADILLNNPERTDFTKCLYEDYETRVKRGARQLLSILT
jgi:glycosyltransferase involved in cell wall biosynthesis